MHLRTGCVQVRKRQSKPAITRYCQLQRPGWSIDRMIIETAAGARGKTIHCWSFLRTEKEECAHLSLRSTTATFECTMTGVPSPAESRRRTRAEKVPQNLTRLVPA